MDAPVFPILNNPETILKINSTSPNNPLSRIVGSTHSDTVVGTQPTTQIGSATKPSVALSPAGRHLAALQDGSKDIQTQKIQQIRNAIASRQLQLDPDRIADGLLLSLRDLLK